MERKQRGRVLIRVCMCSFFFFGGFEAAKVLLGTISSLFLEPLLPCQGVSRVISFLTSTWQPLLSLSSSPPGLLTLYTAPCWLADVQQIGRLWYNLQLPTLAVVCLFCFEHTSAEVSILFPRKLLRHCFLYTCLIRLTEFFLPVEFPQAL